LFTRTLSCFAKMLVVGALIAAPAQPGVVLFDDFESGSLSPSKWLIAGSGQVVTDPLNANNKALSFGQLKAGGDLFSVRWICPKGRSISRSTIWVLRAVRTLVPTRAGS